MTAPEVGLSMEGGPIVDVLRRVTRWPAAVRLGSLQRAVLAAAICWVPLALLSVVSGGGNGTAFIHDISTHARMLLSVPMFILLNRWIGDFVSDASSRMSVLLEAPDRPEYTRIAKRCQRFMQSSIAESALLLLTYAAVLFRIFDRYGVFRPWELTGTQSFTPAAIYFFSVSLPAFYFLALRWIWRYAVWAVFLLRCSTLRLRLMSGQPDPGGMLGFVGRTQVWFSLIAVAAEFAVTGRWAEAVVWRGARIQDFAVIAAVTIAVVVMLFAFPALFFAPHLWRLRFGGLRQLDHLTARISRTFEERWVPSGDSDKFLD
ncbi:MAG: hypothetical protein ACJ790_11285, partial [Myxococcaceae bacterium]